MALNGSRNNGTGSHAHKKNCQIVAGMIGPHSANVRAPFVLRTFLSCQSTIFILGLLVCERGSRRLSRRVKRLVLYDGAPRPVCLSALERRVCAGHSSPRGRDKNDGHRNSGPSVCSSLLSHGQDGQDGQEQESFSRAAGGASDKLDTAR